MMTLAPRLQGSRHCETRGPRMRAFARNVGLIGALSIALTTAASGARVIGGVRGRPRSSRPSLRLRRYHRPRWTPRTARRSIR